MILGVINMSFNASSLKKLGKDLIFKQDVAGTANVIDKLLTPSLMIL